jgi:hypothetical protein
MRRADLPAYARYGGELRMAARSSHCCGTFSTDLTINEVRVDVAYSCAVL